MFLNAIYGKFIREKQNESNKWTRLMFYLSVNSNTIWAAQYLNKPKF